MLKYKPYCAINKQFFSEKQRVFYITCRLLMVLLLSQQRQSILYFGFVKCTYELLFGHIGCF